MAAGDDFNLFPQCGRGCLCGTLGLHTWQDDGNEKWRHAQQAEVPKSGWNTHGDPPILDLTDGDCCAQPSQTESFRVVERPTAHDRTLRFCPAAIPVTLVLPGFLPRFGPGHVYRCRRLGTAAHPRLLKEAEGKAFAEATPMLYRSSRGMQPAQSACYQVVELLNPRTGKLVPLVDDPGGAIRDPQIHYDGESRESRENPDTLIWALLFVSFRPVQPMIPILSLPFIPSTREQRKTKRIR